MKNFLKKYGHGWVFSYAFLYLPWFFYLERTVTSDYAIMHTALDDYIPFNEYFIIPYLFWFLYVAGTVVYFFFTNRQEFYKLWGFLCVGMTISMIICTFFPNGTDLRVPVNPDKNFCSWLVSMLHVADTSTNVFPSIHVYNSIAVHCAIMNSRSLKEKHWLRIGSFITMILICMSTVVLKQHSVLDVMGSVILAYIMYPLVYSTDYAALRKNVEEKVIG